MIYVYLPIVALLLLVGVAQAQVTATTPEEQQGIPLGFLPNAKGGGFGNHEVPKGYTPNPDPHDFTASYVSGLSGLPGGPPPGGGAPTPGGLGPASGGPPTSSSCIPGLDSAGPYPTHIISSPGRLTIITEMEHAIRRIYIGGAHPAHVVPTHMGDSIGFWDGNTLVINTIAIKDQPGVRMLEHWTKLGDGNLNIKTWLFDAKGNARGTPVTSKLIWRPDLTFVEDICEDFGEAFGNSYGK